MNLFLFFFFFFFFFFLLLSLSLCLSLSFSFSFLVVLCFSLLLMSRRNRLRVFVYLHVLFTPSSCCVRVNNSASTFSPKRKKCEVVLSRLKVGNCRFRIVCCIRLFVCLFVFLLITKPQKHY